jgi:hypothetical protein
LTGEEIQSWFDKLKVLYDKNQYKPALMFNWDEAFICAESNAKTRLCTGRDKPKTVMKIKSHPEHITLCCVRQNVFHIH